MFEQAPQTLSPRFLHPLKPPQVTTWMEPEAEKLIAESLNVRRLLRRPAGHPLPCAAQPHSLHMLPDLNMAHRGVRRDGGRAMRYVLF